MLTDKDGNTLKNVERPGDGLTSRAIPLLACAAEGFAQQVGRARERILADTLLLIYHT